MGPAACLHEKICLKAGEHQMESLLGTLRVQTLDDLNDLNDSSGYVLKSVLYSNIYHF